MLHKCVLLLVVCQLLTACASSEDRAAARIGCAENYTGEGYDACVSNALRF
jgi:outer membrane biogenesis lipoprotein LolB